MPLTRAASRDQRGVTLLLFALLITALFVISALVVDLSFVRQNRQVDKSAADFAVAAGIRGFDDGSGKVNSWDGICTALDYLKVNRPDFAALFAVDSSDNPVTPDPCSAPPTEYCVNSPADWRRYLGLSSDGTLRVTIAAGYDLSASGFAEDSSAYAGDEGDDPCEHLAVIIEERQEPFFGGVSGSSGWNTTLRSVARTEVGGGGEIAPALLMLERTKCEVVTAAGGSATIEARGRDGAPGTIHADSDASDPFCAHNRKVFDVNPSSGSPSISALASDDGARPGSITSVSLSGTAGSQPQFTADSPGETCVQVLPVDCVSSPFTGGSLQGRDLVTRSVVDSRYLSHVQGVRSQAAQRFSWSNAQATANLFTPVSCGATDFTSPTAKVFVNCNGNSFDGSGKTFPDGYEVVINGYVDLGASPLNLGNNTRVFIRGRAGGNRRAISFSTGNTLVQNLGGQPTCDARYTDDGGARSLLVIGSGRILGTGGTVRLCQTAVIMLDNTSSACPIPASNGLAPYSNGCNGNVDISGGAIVDWSAPNVNDTTTPSPEELEHFEDLALWSETSDGQGVGGGGGMSMAGIFFTPNADPFTIGGGGGIDLLDAQFVSRRLRANGGGVLTLAPREPNSVTLPSLEGFTLVR
jgi:hypothetical protein